jgi:preprotein translocase SecE subunit
MLAAGIWLAWRIVNVPAFADFLIATEAEMNKVSWTTQRRLVQDTLVVLVTVVLMAFYLFGMDVMWKSVLSWPPIGVLKISSDEQREAAQPPEDRPW